MWSKIKTRLISAVVLIVLVLAALLFVPEWGVAILVSGVTYAVMYELTKVFGLKEKKAITAINFVFATIFMVMCYITSLKHIPLFAVLYIIVLMSVAVVDNEKVSFRDVTMSLFMIPLYP